MEFSIPFSSSVVQQGFLVEYTPPGGRASCTHCIKPINEPGTMRMAYVSRSAENYALNKWFHFACFWKQPWQPPRPDMIVDVKGNVRPCDIACIAQMYEDVEPGVLLLPQPPASSRPVLGQYIVEVMNTLPLCKSLPVPIPR